jgi:hypothetical protein
MITPFKLPSNQHTSPVSNRLFLTLLPAVAALLLLDLQAAQPTVDLRSTSRFALLAGSGITSVPTSNIRGDVGISPSARSTIAGLTPVEVTGSILAADDGGATAVLLTTAKGDLTTAYNDAAGRSLAPVLVPNADLGGRTLAPGLYKSTGTLSVTGDLTLDGQGDANAVFIFQVASTLTAAPGSKVILIGRATAANIFWQVGTSAALGTTTQFKGTIMADQSVSLATGATLDGRALARIGAVTLDANTITTPGPQVISPLSPSFGPISRSVEGNVSLVITNTPGVAITLQTSPNFTDWATLPTPVFTVTPASFIDTTATPDAKRFYRAFYP